MLIKYYTYTWCASKYLEIMQDHHAGSDFIIGCIHLLYCPSFFVVKRIKPINMKSNVCNSLNYSAQYWAS